MGRNQIILFGGLNGQRYVPNSQKEKFGWHHLILWSSKPNWLERERKRKRVSNLYAHFRWIGKTVLLHFVRYLFIHSFLTV